VDSETCRPERGDHRTHDGAGRYDSGTELVPASNGHKSVIEDFEIWEVNVPTLLIFGSKDIGQGTVADSAPFMKGPIASCNRTALTSSLTSNRRLWPMKRSRSCGHIHQVGPTASTPRRYNARMADILEKLDNLWCTGPSIIASGRRLRCQAIPGQIDSPRTCPAIALEVSVTREQPKSRRVQSCIQQ